MGVASGSVCGMSPAGRICVSDGDWLDDIDCIAVKSGT